MVSRGDLRTAPHSAKDIILFKTKKDIQGRFLEVSIVRSHNAYEIRGKETSHFEDSPLKIVLSEE
jgi:hypothetical protein